MELASRECEELLQAILTSRHFAHAGTLKRVLTYLYERSRDPSAGNPKEYEIAVEAMGRPATFDPRTDPVVRVTVSQIRRRLDEFFHSEGAGAPWRLEIPRGRYVVQAQPRSPVKLDPNGPLERFWRPNRGPRRATLIVYTEPLFFKDNQGLYVRHWQVNDWQTGPPGIVERHPSLSGVALEPTFHYLSAGEMRCLLSLSRCFTLQGIAADFRSLRQLTRDEILRYHAVLLGSPRTNTLLADLQRDLPIRATADAIQAPDARGSMRQYRDERFCDGGRVLLRGWAALSRFRHPESGNLVVLIAANHGAAIEATGHALTLEEPVELLLRSLRSRDGDDLPAFQALVEVLTDDWSGEIQDVKFRRVQPLARRKGSAC